MRRRPEAARAAAVVVALASVLLASPGAPPAAADSCDGVWVVVDARAAGGTVTTRCAAGDPATGLAALQGAGHAHTFVPRIPGMVCTIDARPEPCNGAPADAYWSYWYAEAGGSWTYASVGAGTRDPAPGTVEGWRFGDGSAPPGVAPPAAPAPAPAPTPAPEPPAPSTPAPPSTTDPTPSAPDRGDTVDPGSTRPGSSTTSRGSVPPAPPAPSADTTEATSPSAQEPAATETDTAPGRWLLDPRTSPSLPRPDPAPTTGRDTDGARTDVGDDPGDPPGRAPDSSATEVDGATLAATASGEPDGAAPIGPALAAGLLAGIGTLTWRQRRQRDGATS